MSSLPPAPQRWLIFCAIVDNFGDIGVCWRLARQLVRDYQQSVTLMVDDWQTALSFVGRMDACLLSQLDEQGVRIVHWCDQADGHADVSPATIVVEAFGCALPDAVIARMAALTQASDNDDSETGRASARPCWINLEYLSAEPWIESYHCQTSLQTMQSGAGNDRSLATVVLHKAFFFPGFTAASGGLLRERDLLAKHDQWQTTLAQTRSELLAWLDVDSRAPVRVRRDDAIWLSLFAYARQPGARQPGSPQSGNLALTSLFAALAEDPVPVLCLVPVGNVLVDVADALGQPVVPDVGEVLKKGSLSVLVIPFLPLDDYDRLLSACDLNIVRGEDSFVRAQWAARPLVWHAYPQQQNSHLDKLDAFLARYGDTDVPENSEDSLMQFNRFWNLDADCKKVWHDLRPQLPDLTLRARNWQQKLAELPDLASSLMQFYRNRP
ncbi:elongation factor P maturation arginine rhamnosyltransferase EarP [Pseudohongiella acticola]|jgi:uncharacterized repeat protein (TIGR03837 family)|uniref:elongation factor P maturation arginine rhamnosyltransferase EarP n=1 Tax=Pseudohongiella acticola TaxID=1524254 RepID=UPI0030EEA92D